MSWPGEEEAAQFMRYEVSMPIVASVRWGTTSRASRVRARSTPARTSTASTASTSACRKQDCTESVEMRRALCTRTRRPPP